VQRGKQPSDFKPTATMGKGVEELRVCNDAGTCRVFYLARLKEAVYLLRALQKETRATSKQDIEISKRRYTELMRGRR
jgi:phage-related protein